jgi:hypothetical protein
MGWKSVLRSLEADMRRADREVLQEQRELERRSKQIAKMMDQERNAYEAAVNENQIALLVSMHRDCSNTLDWKAIASAPPPRAPEQEPPERGAKNEHAAQAKLRAYNPGVLDKLLRRTNSKRASLASAVEEARLVDDRKYRLAVSEYEQAIKAHETGVADWQDMRKLAARVLAADVDAYGELLSVSGPLTELSLLGSEISFGLRRTFAEADLQIKSPDIVPAEVKTLLKSGKVSSRPMPKTRSHEIYRDYVCGCILRVARELLAMLPIETAIVNTLGSVLNTRTGHIETKPVASAVVPRSSLGSIRWDTAHPAEAMTNFVHRINFKKNAGLSPVEAIRPAEVGLA